MTDNEKKLKVMSIYGDNCSEAIIPEYLADAEAAIMNRLYPFGVPSEKEMPREYENLQIRLAVRYLRRRGAEGQTSHGESSISRHYGSVNEEDLLKEVIPYCELR